MKFNKIEYQILHLREGNPGYTYRLEYEKLESSPMKKNLGFVIEGKLNMNLQCNLVVRRISCTLVCTRPSTASWVREGIVSALHCVASTQALCAGFGDYNGRRT